MKKIFNLGFGRRLPVMVLFLIPAGFSACRSLPPFSSNPAENPPACITEERMLKVRGDSLTGLIEDGAVMKIIMGWYKCHEVGRGDIVVYNYPGGDPLAKIAKGIPGDKFRLKKSGHGCWNILINGKTLKNSKKTPYCIDERARGMLTLYEKGNSGVIPKDACLILANSTGGSMDSTRFGLIGRADLLGRAMPLAGP